MLATKVICPHCGKHLKTAKPLPAGHRVLCSRCGRSFAVASTPHDSPPRGADATPLAPQSADATPLAPRSADAIPLAMRQAVGIGVIIGGLLVAMIATIGLVSYFATRPTSSDASVQAPSNGAEEPAETPNTPTPPESPHQEKPPPQPAPVPEAEREAWLPPQEQERVNKAIENGVRWLKARQASDGGWNGRPHAIGLTALPALTLLECGVPAGDDHIQKAAQRIRKSLPELNQTYEIALVILFLDRLGDPSDEKRIQTCALRLVAGQSAAGGWTYHCPKLTPQREADLLQVMEQMRPRNAMDLFARGPDGSAPPGFVTQAPVSPLDKGLQGDSTESKLLAPGGAPREYTPADPEAIQKALTRLPPNLRKLPSLQSPEKAHQMPGRDVSDNSNTQFAILGLSAAQRHRLPLERALALVVQRFHKSQVHDGRWNYYYSAPGRPADERPAMTGAGLLGLAVGLGLAAEHARPQTRNERFTDPAIEKGFAFLARYIGKPLGGKRQRGRGGSTINLYFLWTVERCGVLFNRRTIEDKDWYRWGEELILDHQNNDGSWSTGGYFAPANETATADTCFALLFLKRANLAKDLTKKLEFFMEGKALQGP